MKFAKKVLIPVALTDNQKDLLKPLRGMDFLSGCEIQFIHVFPTVSYASVMNEAAFIYPMENDRRVIEQSTLATLVRMAEEVLPPHFQGKVTQKVLFAEDPRKMFSDYANEIHADTVIITTKRRHGFFESSFAEYVNKHIDSNMIYLKNKEQE